MSVSASKLWNRPMRVILVLASLFLLIYRLIIVFSYEPELVNGETNNIWNALKVYSGHPLYTDPEKMPLEIFQYSPLSQLPVIVATHLFDAEDPMFIYRITVFGRMCSLLFNIITVMLLYLSARLLMPASGRALVIGCFLAFASLTHLAFAIRPDALALMLMMWGFYLFCRFYSNGTLRELLASAMVLAMAFLAKQDAMVVIAPLSFLLLVQKRWRELLMYDGVFLLTLAGLLATGHIILGEYFLSSVIMGVRNPATWEWARYVLTRLFSFYGSVVILGNLAIIFGILHLRTYRSALPFIFAALFYELFAFATSFKIGAGVSYYTPFILLSSALVVSMASDRLRKKHPDYSWIILGVVMVLSAVFVFRQAYHYTSPFLRYQSGKELYLLRWEHVRKLKDELRLAETDRIIAPDPLTRLLLHAYSVMPNMEFYRISPYRYEAIKEAEDEPIDYIVMRPDDMRAGRLTMEFFEISFDRYTPLTTGTDYLVLGKTDR